MSLINITISKRGRGRDHFLFYIILFRLSLDFLYVFVLKDYSKSSELLSTGIFNLEVNIAKYLLSWLVFLIFLVFLKRGILLTRNKASEIIILGLFIMSFIPSISLFGLANLDYEFLLYFTMFWAILLGLTYLFCNIKYKHNKVTLKNSLLNSEKFKYIIWMSIVYIFCFGVILISWKYSGLRLNLTLDSVKIYQLRSQAELGTILDYFRNNAMYIVIPFAAIYCFQKRKWLLLCFLVWIQLLLYGIDNQKAALFILPVSILGYVFYKKYFIGLIPKFLVLGNIIIYIEAVIGKSTFLISTLLERIYYLPAILSNCYFEYFRDIPPVMPFVSLLEKMGLVTNYQYKTGVPYLIADKFLNNPYISANTGMFGSAFSYGIVGVILIPIAYAYFFHLLDLATSNLEIKTFISVLIILVYVITGATIFVVLSVYGFVMAIIMLSLVNNNSRFQIERNTSHKKKL